MFSINLDTPIIYFINKRLKLCLCIKKLICRLVSILVSGVRDDKLIVNNILLSFARRSNVECLLAGMKMTMSTTATMSARVHRKVMRAPHKRVHPGKMLHAGKMVHPGKNVHGSGKFAHLGKFGKLGHYAHTHSLRPPEPCENSNDSGLGPDPGNR